MAKKKPFSIKARNGEADIYIYDDIGDSFDGTTAKSFAADLKAVKDAKQLNIYLNSPGGSVFEGVAIYNQIKRHKARKIVNIDGLAASIASVIAMAGDEINIALNGMMMIHDPWALTMGSATDMRRMADNLDKVRDTLLDTYVARTGEERDFVSEMMADETWMNAQDAVDLGFADNVTGEVEMAAKVKDFDLTKFKHPPEDLIKVMRQTSENRKDDTREASEPEAGAPASRSQQSGKNRMSVAKMKRKLRQRGIKEDRGASPAQQAAE